jgi:hypothetical protein
MREMMIKATNVNVAFQTMPVTSITSVKVTTPKSNANSAPPQADQPMDSPLGCQITNTNVSKKITDAKIISSNKIPP